MTRTLASAMGTSLSIAFLTALTFSAAAAEQHEGGFAAAWTAIAGNGANQSAAAQAMLTDDMETGSVLTLRASSSASSGAGLSAASAAIDPSAP